MKITALLTGKANNTLRDKNLLRVRERPLLYYPAMAARRSAHLQRFYVSSDGAGILATAAALGYKEITRPPELSLPESRHIDAIEHALTTMAQRDNHEPDILVVLLANNISIKTEWIDSSIQQILSDPTISAVAPVYEDQDHHPYRAKRIGEDGAVTPFVPLEGDVSTNRQDLPPCFYLCHNFWTLNLHRSARNGKGHPPWGFMGPRVMPLVVEETVDVHMARDIILCEDWLTRNNIKYD